MPEYPEIQPAESAQDPVHKLTMPAYKAEKEYKPLDKKEKVFIAVFFLLSFILVDFSLLPGFRLGFTIVYFLIFAAATVFLWNKEKKPSVFSVLCGVLSLAGSVTYAIYCNYVINSAMMVLIAGLFTLYCIGISGSFRHPQGSLGLAFDLLSGFLTPFAAFPYTVKSVRQTFSGEKKNYSALIGILLSLPFLMVIIPLLVKSDAAFEGLVSSISDNFRVYIIELFCALVIFPYAYCYMFSKKRAFYSRNTPKNTEGGKVQSSGCVSFLSVISVTYIVYLFSQLAYFFSAFKGILPDDYTKSASMFARRGFYEMFVICVINVVIVSAAGVLVKKDHNGRAPLSVRLLSLFISLFSVLLIVVAMVKMKLNIDTYGFTINRLLVSVFMVMMFVIITFFIIHIFAPKVSYVQPVIIICSAMFVALAYFNVDSFTYKYNVNAYLNGTIEEFDIYNIDNLAPSEEYLIKAIKDGVMADEAKELLMQKFCYNDADFIMDLDEFKVTAVKTDFRAYCFKKDKAKQLAAEYVNSLPQKEKEEFKKAYYDYFRYYPDDMNEMTD